MEVRRTFLRLQINDDHIPQRSEQIGRFQDDGRSPYPTPQRNLRLVQHRLVNQDAQRGRQAKGGHCAHLIAGNAVQFLRRGHRQAGLAQQAAQLLPINLLRPGDENHQEFILRQAEEQAAHHLLWPLIALGRRLLQGVDRAGVVKQGVGDLLLIQFVGNRCFGHDYLAADGADYRGFTKKTATIRVIRGYYLRIHLVHVGFVSGTEGFFDDVMPGNLHAGLLLGGAVNLVGAAVAQLVTNQNTPLAVNVGVERDSFLALVLHQINTTAAAGARFSLEKPVPFHGFAKMRVRPGKHLNHRLLDAIFLGHKFTGEFV